MTTQKHRREQTIEPFKHFKSIQGNEFDTALKLLHDYADEYGLSEEDVQIVTESCLTPKIAMFRLKVLIQSLIPVTYVPESSIRKALEWLLMQRNEKVPVLSTKFILQWLSGLVEYNLDQRGVIDKYYDFFYYYLAKKHVDIYASKLIYLLTKPRDVRRWYVKQVLRIHEIQNKPKHTSVLLYLFKMYRPDCVPENIQAHAVHTVFGSLPERLIRGFTRARDNIAQNSSIPQNLDNILWIQLNVRKNKKNAVQLIPSVAQNEINLNVYQDESKSLLSISNRSDLHKYHLSMSSPGRAMALLNNSVGYHLLTFCDTDVHSRFSCQLYYTLHDAFLEANQLVSKDEKINLLKRLSFLQIHMQQSIPVLSKFLAEYIIRWDGHEYDPHIYRLMRWLHIVSFRELRDCILNFLFTIFISDTIVTKCKILGFLGDIACNMILTHANRISNKQAGLFLNMEQEWTLDDIKKLYEYIYSICNVGLHISKGHSLLIDSIIHLHYKIIQAETMSHIKLFRVSKHMLYYTLFSTNPTLLARVCNLINRSPQYILKDVQQNFLSVLWYNKALPFNSGNDSVDELEVMFKKFHFAEALEWRQHFGLACYNIKILEKVSSSADFENFIIYASSHYPSVCEFLGRSV